MRIRSRRKTIAFFIVLGVLLVGIAVTLNITWIVLNWRAVGRLVLGIVFFAVIIAGLILNTIFLVREIRRNEQHDSFINAVTHELKTPIASIRLYLETLQTRALDDAQRREFYTVMLADSDRLLHTVEQVLRAGIAGQKGRKVARLVIDLPSLVHESVELARARHHLEPEALHFEDTAPPVSVVGDPDELQTAVTNLLDNAVKYSDPPVRVTVKVERVGDDRVALRVLDSGIGIPPSELKEVFQRFYRVRTRARRKVRGTGLGLFIVRSIAEKHGGRAYAESEGEGRGSRFTLELPAATA